jgi:anti-sigma factor RsiW
MHEPVKEHLEDYLKGYGDREMPPELAAHLEACAACTEELREWGELARIYKALRL